MTNDCTRGQLLLSMSNVSEIIRIITKLAFINNHFIEKDMYQSLLKYRMLQHIKKKCLHAK